MKQDEFAFALHRDFIPSEKRSSPFVWVEELRVYKTYAPEDEQCKYQLNRGLNILWAAPGDGKVVLYKKGIKGHAAGKTTFCRLIRYLLGEQTFGTAGFKQSLFRWSANALVVGKIWVDDECWIVSKTLGINDKHDMAFRGDKIEQIFNPPSGCRKPSDFSDMMGKQVVKPMTAKRLPYGAQLSWRYLLPWLTRDQECRLAHLLNWRDPSTESNRPDTPIADACYIVRSVMDLITEEEETALENHKKLQKRAKDLDQNVPLLRHEVKKGIERVLPWASNKGIEAPLLFEDIKQTMTQKNAQLQKSPELARLRKKYDKLREQYDSLNSKVIAFETAYTNQKSLFDLDEKAHRAKAGKHTQKKAETEIDGERPAPLGRCNVLLSHAILHCPLAKGRQLDFESHKNLMTVEQTVQAEKEGLEAARQAIDQLRAELMGLKLKLSQLGKQRDAAQIEYDTFRDKLNQELGVYRQMLTDVGNVQLNYDTMMTSEAEQKSLQTDIRDSNALQETIRKRFDKKRVRVNELFDDLIKAVLGDDMSASFTANAQTIDLKVDCDGERVSAATETIKILAFDIAAMLLSAEGFGNHPRFLIHDSPREADMQKDIYQRFFLYMRELEKKGRNCIPNFQYIITTTEPPPEELQKKPWLVAKLDASKAEGRLLRVNL